MVQFTVVTPFLNAGGWLQQGIHASVHAMEGVDAELLLVDDGSVDDSPAIARRWAGLDRRISVLTSQTTGGPGEARNHALGRAQGTWCVFVDSDDVLLPDALRQLASASAARPDADLIFNRLARGLTVRGPAAATSTGTPVQDVDLDGVRRRHLELRTTGALWQATVRRSLVGSLRFRRGVHEDVDMLWQWFRHAECAVRLGADIVRVVPRVGSVTRTISTGHIDGFIAAWSAIGRDLRTAPGDPAWPTLHRIGAAAVLATRVRAIHELTTTPRDAQALYDHLHRTWTEAFPEGLGPDRRARRTTYRRIADMFLTVYSTPPASAAHRAASIAGWMATNRGLRWSCDHLEETPDPDLAERLQAGEFTEHDSCPSLAYRAWGRPVT